MIINWKALDRIQGPGKYFNLMFILFIVMLNISYGFSNPIIDNYGHIGGLIYGFFLIFIIQRPDEQGDGMGCSYYIWRWISIAFLVMLYLGGIVLLALLK